MKCPTNIIWCYVLLYIPNLVSSHPVVSSEDTSSSVSFSDEGNGFHHFLLPDEELLEDEENLHHSSEDDDGRSRRDVCNNEVVTLPENISALFNHSYEVRCSPKIKFEVDGLVLDVKKEMQLVLRFICLLARTYNSSYPSHGVTGFRFGYIVSSEPFNVTDFTPNSPAKKRFDVVFEDNPNDNATEVYATFSHSCNQEPPGAHFMVGDRTVKPLTVVWMLLSRLACRDWWEGRTSRDDEDDNADDEQRIRRDISNDIEKNWSYDIEGNPSFGHQCEISCAFNSESLTIIGVKLTMTPHLKSALHLLCSSLPVSEENNGHFSFKAHYITDIDFDMEAHDMDTVANKSFDVVYEDGQKRSGQNLYTFYWRCEPEPIFSVMGHKLVSHSLLWNVFKSMKCETGYEAPRRRFPEGSDEPKITAQKSSDSERRRKDVPSHFHNFDVGCGENSVDLIVDDITVKITPHMRGAIAFLCELLKLSKTAPDEVALYRLGYIATEDSFNAEDYAMNSSKNETLDVEYADGTVDTRTSITVFGQTCFPHPLGPEFSLDAGILQPRSIMWGLIRKVRCVNEETDSFDFFNPGLLAFDHIEKPRENVYTNNHSYEVRCTPGAESLLVDGYVMEMTEHFFSALRILCYSSGLHQKEDASIRLGYFKSIEYFNPQEHAINSTSQKRLDVLFRDGESRAKMRVASMMPNCQSSPPQFEFNGKRVQPQSLVWTLYKKLECDNRSTKVVNDPALRTSQKGVPLQKSNTGYAKSNSSTSPSNTHDYAVKCRHNAEKLIIDGKAVRVTRHMHRVLRLLCNVIDIFYSIPEDNIYRFGYIVTKESFKPSDYAPNSTSNNRLDVQYSSSIPRSDKDPISLKSTCRRDPPGNEMSLNGSRLVPHSIVWSLFSRVRCPAPNTLVPQEPAASGDTGGTST